MVLLKKCHFCIYLFIYIYIYCRTNPIITMYGIIEALLMGLAELFPTAYIASIKQLKFRVYIYIY